VITTSTENKYHCDHYCYSEIVSSFSTAWRRQQTNITSSAAGTGGVGGIQRQQNNAVCHWENQRGNDVNDNGVITVYGGIIFFT